MPWINDEIYRRKNYTPMQNNTNPSYSAYTMLRDIIINTINSYGRQDYHDELPHFDGVDYEEWLRMFPITDHPSAINQDDYVADVDKLEVIFRVEWYNYLVKFIKKLLEVATARKFIPISLSHPIPTEKVLHDYIRQDWANAYNLICDCMYEKTQGERRWIMPRVRLVDRWGQAYFWYWNYSTQTWWREPWYNDANITTDYTIIVENGVEYYLFPDGTKIQRIIA